MSASLNDRLKHEFADPEYRAAYAGSFVDAWIAMQIRVIREQRGMTQQELADRLRTTQTAISRLENANYSGRGVTTLKNIAKVFDCRLKVSFETYGSLIREAEDFCVEFLRRPNFSDDAEMSANPTPNFPNLPPPAKNLRALANPSQPARLNDRDPRGPIGEMVTGNDAILAQRPLGAAALRHLYKSAA